MGRNCKILQCHTCGRKFRRIVYHRSKHYYCGRKCQRGKNSSNWKGGKRINNGYWAVLSPRWKQGYIYEHILIAERALGRRLKKGEVVHHINGNKLDNRPCNLLICTQSYHRWLHEEMARRYMQEHFAPAPNRSGVGEVVKGGFNMGTNSDTSPKTIQGV